MIRNRGRTDVRAITCSILLSAVLAQICMPVFASAFAEPTAIPALKSNLSPLAQENRSLLQARLVAAFDKEYARHRSRNRQRNLADAFAVYYLRRELQALIDMWRATGKIVYLKQAEDLVLAAIAAAEANPQPLLWHNQSRGKWPCFFLKKVEKQKGGHNQICDFQGAAGFLMVADALRQAGQDRWKQIADFVEKNIVEKWLFYIPTIRPSQLRGPESTKYLLILLDSARDKREYFAVICMDLDEFGYRKYDYGRWAKFLTDLYVGERANLARRPPGFSTLDRQAPDDWGVVPRKSTGGYVWHYIPSSASRKVAVLDTSHANRTVWLATKAYERRLVGRKTLDGFINTFRYQIWAPAKGPFHFNNYVDGSDAKQGRLGPGQGGNIWFGWHRLAAYDDGLRDLFVSVAYDLTNGGPNIPRGAQNKAMENAPLCFYAWAARLLSPDGQPQRFP